MNDSHLLRSRKHHQHPHKQECVTLATFALARSALIFQHTERLLCFNLFHLTMKTTWQPNLDTEIRLDCGLLLFEQNMFHPFPHATACFLVFSSKIGPHPRCKDDVIQRKQKSGKTVKAIIKPKHQLAKQRRRITGSYTEGKPKIRPARSVTEEQNNRSCNPTNTPNPDNNKSYRLQRPVKMALWKSDQITASVVNCHKFFSFCFRDIVDNVDDFPCRLCCFLSRYHCHCNLFGKESERKKVFGQTPHQHCEIIVLMCQCFQREILYQLDWTTWNQTKCWFLK